MPVVPALDKWVDLTYLEQPRRRSNNPDPFHGDVFWRFAKRLEPTTHIQPAVKFGIAIPQGFGKEPVDVALIENFLGQADTLGFHSLWVQEVIDAALLEPVMLLTYAAALTQRIRLGSAILLTALRSPLQVAKTLSSLDHLSRGRLIVGVGLGSNTEVYPGYGISTEKRLRRFIDGIDLLKALWTEERVSRDSRVLDAC